MRLPFGLEIRKAAPVSASVVGDNRGGWWPWVREPFGGAWQRNVEWTTDTVISHHAVYTCISLISQDVAKLRPMLVQLGSDGIWSEVPGNSPFLSVLRKPNHYQNRIQFIEWWMTSKLMRGNTYVLKERDNRGVVRHLYVLDSSLVQVMVAPDGSVFYTLSPDNLSGLQESVSIPASEIIHDRINCLFHPLIGTSPIFASGLAAYVGLTIEKNAAGFFSNGSLPSGLLSAPAKIASETADRLKDHWEREYTGQNAGKVAVLGDGLSFEPMRMSAVDAQMIEHLKWTAETVVSTFHVPAFKAGIGQMPTYQNGETLNHIYYTDCLQSHIEAWELCMDEGLGLDQAKDKRTLGVELDLDGLLRMDTAGQTKELVEGISGGLYAPNEGRRKKGLGPVVGGDTPYLQQQNYSLAALDERDRNNPFPAVRAPEGPAETPVDDSEAALADWYWRAAELEVAA